MGVAKTFLTDLTFIDVLLVITLAGIIVTFWQRWLENLMYNTLSLNRDSTYHSFVIAFTITAILIIFIFSFESLFGDIVENDFESGLNP